LRAFQALALTMLVGISSVPMAARSQTSPSPNPMSLCSSIWDKAERLACYDRVVTEKPQQPRASNRSALPDGLHSGSPGGIVADIASNLLENSRDVFMRAQAAFNQFDFVRRRTLLIRCKDKRLDVYVDWGEKIEVGRQGIAVAQRFDAGSVSTSSWNGSTSGDTTFHPQPLEFLRQAGNSSTVVVQTRVGNKSPITAEFNIAGLRNILEATPNACWDDL
jgi:hypothetical protein